MPTQRAVMITGSSTGIGEACALHLDRLGLQVFAGVRKDVDGEALRRKASAALQPVRIDITSGEEIQAAAEMVRSAVGESGLAGLGQPRALLRVQVRARSAHRLADSAAPATAGTLAYCSDANPDGDSRSIKE